MQPTSSWKLGGKKRTQRQREASAVNPPDSKLRWNFSLCQRNTPQLPHTCITARSGFTTMLPTIRHSSIFTHLVSNTHSVIFLYLRPPYITAVPHWTGGYVGPKSGLDVEKRIPAPDANRIGWLDLLAPWLQVFLITLKYSAIADLHNFQFTVAHALGLSVFTSRLLATVLNTETSTWNNQWTIHLEE
jgi:hypothetical protein